MIQRQFLGWDRPALHTAVDVLYDGLCHGSIWDMSNITLALPGARTGRRLLELLAIKAAGELDGSLPIILMPPDVTTSGHVPEALYPCSVRTASELEVVQAWSAALQATDRTRLSAVFARLPEEGKDAPQWLRLAAEMAALSSELAGEMLSFDQVLGCVRALNLPTEADRWQVLAEICGEQMKLLKQHAISTRDQERVRALETGSWASGKTVILVGASDLTEVTCACLRAAAGRGTDVLALVHAPESEADAFDDLGCLDSGHWKARPICLKPTDIRIVDFPTDQANAVAEEAQKLSNLPLNMITVGVADDTMTSMMERVLQLAGTPARRAVAASLAVTAPVRLLNALSAYLHDRTSESWAALLRHPDINDYLVNALAGTKSAGAWIRDCDKYLCDHLPHQMGEAGKMPESLEDAVRATKDLVSVDGIDRRPLADWASPIAEILSRLYDHPQSRRALSSDQALSAVGDALQRISDAAHVAPGLTKMTLAEGMRYVADMVASQPVPGAGGEDAVEIVGWLEVMLDDAPALIVSGFNEGFIPQSISGDPLLPDSLRSSLKLLDNDRRCARDSYVLSAILASKKYVKLISGRWSASNDPLAPSRLYFACTAGDVVDRVLRYYGAPETPPSPRYLHAGASYTMAALPPPAARPDSTTSLSVTAFKDYLSCPYRFYLKNILRLTTDEDGLVEMSPSLVGSLIHSVLQEFASYVVKDLAGEPPSDAHKCYEHLQESRVRLTEERFGKKPRAAIALQMHDLDRRLKVFAAKQAREADQGWRICAAEAPIDAEVDVSGTCFHIRGRVDRIDRHDGTGMWRVLDYKSFDKDRTPEQTHRTKDGTWIDLQLPMYRRFAPQPVTPGEKPAVGYVILDANEQTALCRMAEWSPDDFSAADRCADEILEKIRNSVFWPPNEMPPTFSDGFEAICRDLALDRSAIIQAASAGAAKSGGARLGQEGAPGVH